MKIRRLIVTGMLMSIAPLSHADEKLFPTDILNQGDFDVLATLKHQSQSRDVVSNRDPGSQSTHITSGNIQIRYGLGSNWLIGADFQHDPQYVTNTHFSKPIDHLTNTSNQGSQNPGIWAKYGFLNDPSSPWTLSTQFEIFPDTTNRGAAYEARVASGWKSSDTLRYYGQIIANLKERDTAADSIGIDLGAYENITDDITLVPHVGFSQFQSTSTTFSFSQFDVGLNAQIQASDNTYLIPGVSYFRNGSEDAKNGTFHAASSDGRVVNIALYHLF